MWVELVQGLFSLLVLLLHSLPVHYVLAHLCEQRLCHITIKVHHPLSLVKQEEDA